MDNPKRRLHKRRICLWLGLVMFLAIPADAQDRFSRWGRGSGLWTYDDQAVVNPWENGGPEKFPSHLFTFARVRYSQQRRGYGWQTDYPDSDINFSQRLSEMTTIEVNRDKQGRIIHVVLDIMDERIFEYPFIYMVEVGNLHLSSEEAAQLRQYFLRGGFLMIDDFWDDDEWYNWLIQFEKIFPDDSHPLVEIPTDHEIYRNVFFLKETPQVPSIHSWLSYRSETDRPGARASCWGAFDEDGRLMMAVLHNTDLGDGWEKENVDFEYFQRFSVERAYPFGINIVVYAMTH